jgi:uncharacterized spore protein YtfJ
MAFAIEEMIKNMISELKELAKTETVVGEPIEIDGKKIIPVIKVNLGFGGGGGEDTEKGRGAGAGAGGGVKVEPVGFIVVKEEDVSMLPIKGTKLEKLAEVVPELISKIKAGKEKKAEEKEQAPPAEA